MKLHRFDDNERGQKRAAFSIQNIAHEGLKFGKLPGDWYGISMITQILETLNAKYQPLKGFKICNFLDGNIILEDI